VSVRRSSSGQDVALPSAETAVRIRPRRSIVKALVVREVSLPVVRGLVEREHYTRSCPAVATHAFAVELDDRLDGAAVLTTGAVRAHKILAAATREDVVTLSRLWLSDRLPKNAESRVLGVIVRKLRREGRFKALVTFADPAAGHDGTIYRAVGFVYTGTTQPERYLVIDGKPCHPRSVSSAHGSNHAAHLRRTGISAERVWAEPKHRYVAILDPAWTWRLRSADAS
jgi:hypothetical protein